MKKFLVAVVLPLVFLTAACGSSDSKSDPAPSAPAVTVDTDPYVPEPAAPAFNSALAAECQSLLSEYSSLLSQAGVAVAGANPYTNGPAVAELARSAAAAGRSILSACDSLPIDWSELRASVQAMDESADLLD